ncbi:MAG: heparinase II/III family protein [Planctomycetes bacterium]|nr:heparinase II/III family protein [Planctomycetota bacterium]
MNFQLGCAAELYRMRMHPRVLIGPNDLDRLKRRCRAGDGRKLLLGLRRKLDPIVNQMLQGENLSSSLGEAIRKPDFLWMGNIHDLALTGLVENDDRYLEAARKLLLSLPVAFGHPEKLSPGVYGNLAGVYLMCYGGHPLAYDLLYSQLNPEEISTYCRWVVELCIRPAIARARPNYFKCAGANTPICETLPALIGLLTVMGDPGVPDLSAELKELVSWLEATLSCAIHSNGYPAEDIGYGTAVAAFLAEIVEPLRRSGVYDVYASCPRYARFGQAVLHFVQPWGRNLSNTGDHGDDFGWRELILARQAEETESPALLWLLGTLSYGDFYWKERPPLPSFLEVPLRNGFQAPASALSLLAVDRFKKAKTPGRAGIPTSFCDPERGIVSFRSGWKEDDTFVVFDGCHRSPAAQGHAHDSCSHFSLSALGEYFAIDTGRYCIEQNQHNVVLVDGRSGRSTDGEWRMSPYGGILTDFRPDAFCDTAAADSSHQHDCYWARRTLGLVKGRGAPAYVWTLEDINKANDWAEFWWQLHTSPENVITVRRRTATIRGWRKGNRLDVHFVLPVASSYPKPYTLSLARDVATPSSFKYIPKPQERARKFDRPSYMLHGPVFVRPRLIAKVAGYNGRFASILLPRPKGAKPAPVERLASLDNSLAVRIVFDKVEDTLIWAYEHRLLEAGDVKGRGSWCVVRRSRASGRVLAAAMGDGTSLEIGGVPVPFHGSEMREALLNRRI